jgi:hypothetical protein
MRATSPPWFRTTLHAASDVVSGLTGNVRRAAGPRSRGAGVVLATQEPGNATGQTT